MTRRMIRASVLSTLLPLFYACSGCILFDGETKESAPEITPKTQQEPEASEAKVKQVWQEVMFNRLEQEDSLANEAYGLFSEGGWSDAGQVMVFTNPTRTAAWMVPVAPGAKEVGEKKDLEPDEWQKLKEVLNESAGVGDIDVTSFDGLVFEYVHARKTSGGGAEAVRRVYIKTGGEPSPPHDRLIASFLELLQKKKR